MTFLNDGGGGSALRAALPVGPDLPCLQDPELFFAESPRDVEQAKALCRGCRAKIACLTGALGRGEPWGVWGGELLVGGVIVPCKRPRGRPRKTGVRMDCIYPGLIMRTSTSGWSAIATTGCPSI